MAETIEHAVLHSRHSLERFERKIFADTEDKHGKTEGIIWVAPGLGCF